MQEKEMMTQPRIDTATLIKACIALQAGCDLANIASITIHFSDEVKSDSEFENFVLSQIADRLAEQEETIRHLRGDLSKAVMVAMEHWKIIEEHRDTIFAQEATIRHLRLEICNASAVAMGHLGTIKTFREELDLLNKRPKR
jgi:hypothetical protein